MRNKTSNCFYEYVNLLYYEQRSLLHIVFNVLFIW